MVDSIGKIREPERELEVFEDRQRRRYIRGMVLTRLIAAAIVADGLLVSLEYRLLLPLVVSSALAIALYMGVRWVKGLLIAGFGLGVPLTLYMLLQGGLYFPSRPLGGAVYTSAVLYPLPVAAMAAHLVFCLLGCLVLLFSKSVDAFLYAQKKRIETRPYIV